MAVNVNVKKIKRRMLLFLLMETEYAAGADL